MKKHRIIGIMLALALGASVLTGCSKEEFDFSKRLEKNGMFKGVDIEQVVSLPDYDSFEYGEDALAVSEEDIEQHVNALLEEHKTANEIKDREVKDGDTLNIDYVGSVDGEEFEGGSTGGNGTEVTIGVTQYIDDFLEQLIGHTPGENFDIEVTFPDPYPNNEDLAGKDAVFNITINSIIEYTYPELTDEFIKENYEGTYESVDDMYEKITADILSEQKLDDKWNQLIEGAQIDEMPKEILEFEQQVMLNYYKAYASQFNMELQDYFDAIGVKNEKEFFSKNEEQIMSNAKTSLTTQAVMLKEGLEVSDDDLTEYFDDYSALEKVYGKPYLKLAVMQDIVRDKILAE